VSIMVVIKENVQILEWEKNPEHTGQYNYICNFLF
jgi:hypothetical protein